MLEFTFRPKVIKTNNDGQAIEYAALMPNTVAQILGMPGASRGSATFVGRLIIDREAITWRPAKLSKIFASEVTFPVNQIKSLTVRRIKNFTPLGYLHIDFTDGRPAIDLRVFQPKTIEHHILLLDRDRK